VSGGVRRAPFDSMEVHPQSLRGACIRRNAHHD
jgi:hypothetical protein